MGHSEPRACDVRTVVLFGHPDRPSRRCPHPAARCSRTPRNCRARAAGSCGRALLVGARVARNRLELPVRRRYVIARRQLPAGRAIQGPGRQRIQRVRRIGGGIAARGRADQQLGLEYGALVDGTVADRYGRGLFTSVFVRDRLRPRLLKLPRSHAEPLVHDQARSLLPVHLLVPVGCRP